MATDGEKRRQKLFRHYAANLRVFFPAAPDCFVCPVCTRAFVEQSVLSESLCVNVGHVYPKEVGGKVVTLECCDCNGRLNRAGDNEIVRLHKLWEAAGTSADVEPAKGYIEMPSGPVGIDISGAGIHAHWKRASKAAFAEACDAMLNHTPVKIVIEGTDPGRVNVGTLHSAHLLFFRAFAYGYLLSPVGRYVQQILHTPDRLDDAPFVSLAIPADAAGGAADMLYRVGICTTADNERCFFATLPVPDPAHACQFVFLPGLWDEDVEAYKEFCRLGDRWLRADYQSIDGAPRARLNAPEYANYLALLWKGATHAAIDLTKMMRAIRAAVRDSTLRKTDAAVIGARFALSREYLTDMIAHLADAGFLERKPKRDHPFLVRLTPKAIAVA